MAEIDVAQSIETFKQEIIPLMSLAELQAFQKYLKAEIDLRESAQPQQARVNRMAQRMTGTVKRPADSASKLMQSAMRALRGGRE